MTLPSSEDFATEVKSDRLKTLYRITLVVCGTALIFLFAFGISGSLNNKATFGLGGAMLALVVGSLIAHRYVNQEDLRRYFPTAAWGYALSALAAIGILLYQGDEQTLQTVPYFFPVITFIIGLLVAPTSTFFVAVIGSLIVMFVPYAAGYAEGVIGLHQGFAILLVFISAALATQVTGELYQITQWALMNYQRERRTNDELFEKRRELQRSLKRSEALADQLRDINSELESAKELAEEAKNFRGQFLANMSHELRTPLNAIIGFSETMLQFPIMYDEEILPPAYERDLHQIYGSGKQLLHVINDILDLAKVDAGKLEIHMQPTNIEPVISAVISTAKGLLGAKPVKLDKKVPEDVPMAWVDESRLRQVLLNLYSNACKYTDEGSIVLTVDLIGDELQIAVADTGVGIDPEFHNKLFEEFEQARAAGRDPRSGSGLGLAITKQLLTLMGGRIWMESEVGAGSTFYFAVQKYQGQDQQAADVVVETASQPAPDVMPPIAQNDAPNATATVEG